MRKLIAAVILAACMLFAAAPAASAGPAAHKRLTCMTSPAQICLIGTGGAGKRLIVGTDVFANQAFSLNISGFGFATSVRDFSNGHSLWLKFNGARSGDVCELSGAVRVTSGNFTMGDMQGGNSCSGNDPF